LKSSLHGHAQLVKCLAFSGDGKLLVSGSADGQAIVWDGRIGIKLASQAAHENSVYGVAFSPDGQLLATASFDRSIKVWRIEGL
jgi:WD40 repeat protein